MSSRPPRVATGFAHLPLRFEENRGQFARQARYVARQGGLALFLTDEGAVMTLRKATTGHARTSLGAPTVLRMRVRDADGKAHLEARAKLGTRSSYFIGDDPRRWRTDVPSFGEVAYRGVRPGVDLVFHGARDGRLEYDFVISPGASPNVTLEIDGTEQMRVADDGALEIQLADGVLRQPPPTVYQMVNGKRQLRSARYRVLSDSRVAFALSRYDHARPLIIDPLLVYSTYLGGSGNDMVFQQHPTALDGAGALYVAGYTTSADFPTANALQSTLGGTQDGFVAKLTPAGDALEYATYVGGSSADAIYGIAVDAAGATYVVGYTFSSNFPTLNALQPTITNTSNAEAFVTKLSPAGDALVYSTYLGGDGADEAEAVAVDASGAAYVGGFTISSNFPTTAHPVQAALAGNTTDGFVTKLSPSGSALVYSTYLGGTGYEQLRALAIDGSGAAYVTGITASTDFPTQAAIQSTAAGLEDVFVAKLVADGSALAYSTYLGGSDDDYSYDLVVDGSGAAYVAGQTLSTNFPTANAYQAANAGNDAFVAKLSADGAALVYSTYLGGSKPDWAFGIAIDARGAAYLAGGTFSTDFPISHALQPTLAGSYDGFVTKLTPSGAALAYSTYLGGTQWDNAFGIDVDASGAAYISGVTLSTDLPTAGAAQAANGGGDDTFLAKIAYPPLVATPQTATLPPRGSQQFVATGGTGEGYTWTSTTNASGGSVDGTGYYTAGATGSVTDILTLTDSAGLVTTTITITVTAGVSITPPSATVASGEMIAFSATGGSGAGYAWTIATNASGGNIDPATGSYSAGPASGSDVIHVVDALGNAAEATVTVTAAAMDDAGAVGAPDLATTAPTDLAMSVGVDAASTPPSDAGAPGHVGGCGCTVGEGNAPTSSPAGALLMAGLVLWWRRRRRLRGSGEAVSACARLP